MSADQLSEPPLIAEAVVAVLGGAALDRIAAGIGMPPTDLADAVEVFVAAGQAALEVQAVARDWYQVQVQFAHWDAAEHLGANQIAPYLRQAQDAGVVAQWWFIRKAPCWRVRCRPGPAAGLDAAGLAEVRATLAAILDGLVAAGQIERWWRTVYEPEACAFGGQLGMDVAHTLFHADSIGVLDYLGQAERRVEKGGQPERIIGRRELSILLCTALLQGARQDWHEQGDVWHRVAQMRPLAAAMAPVDRLRDMTPSLHRLMNVDVAPRGAILGPGGPLSFALSWVTAFRTAGESLRSAAHNGTLRRGLRDILAHHIIFHWNRFGLPARTQAVLARAACDAVMNPPVNALVNPSVNALAVGVAER
jgi:thiopeptide-type bacteriocin biosynthesis protein